MKITSAKLLIFRQEKYGAPTIYHPTVKECGSFCQFLLPPSVFLSNFASIIMSKPVYILGIESSCDDTSAAVVTDEALLLSNVIASQAVHEEYGGVVPELASRAHQQNIVPVVDAAIKRAGINLSDLSAIAYTRGPAFWARFLSAPLLPKGCHLACAVRW